MVPLVADRRPHNGTPEYRTYRDAAGTWGGQVAVIRAALAHFLTIAVFGRSSGKSATVPFLFLEEWRTCPDPVYEFAYCAPFGDGARDAYMVWKALFADMLDPTRGLTGGHSDVGLILHLRWHGMRATVDFWGLAEHDNLRRYRKHRIVVDEGKDVEENAVFSTLLPMLLARARDGFGGILIIGTPSRFGVGARWMRNVYRRAAKNEDPSWCALNAPSMCNPWLTPDGLAQVVNAAMLVGGDLAVREEIHAEWLPDEGAVFGNLDAVFVVPILRETHDEWVAEDPDKGERYVRVPDRYVIGVDVGISHDRFIITTFNLRTRRQAHLVRLLGKPPHVARDRVKTVKQLYGNCPVYYDAGGGYGLALAADSAIYADESYVPKKWNAVTKGQDIQRAAALCQRAGLEEQVAGPGWYFIKTEWQRIEFESFEMKARTHDERPRDQPKYSAPPKGFDDAVTAACLISERIAEPYVPTSVPEVRAATPYDVAWWDARRAEAKRGSGGITTYGGPRRR